MKPVYKKNSLKGKILNLLKIYKILTRPEVYIWSKKHGYEQATTERRLRELKSEMGVTPLNDQMKKADTKINEHIFAWKYRPTSVFKNKL